MPRSIKSPEVLKLLNDAQNARHQYTPSPADWRDVWIYFVITDRFNNPNAAPKKQPWNSDVDTFQGGTFNGIRAQLDYLKNLGVGALWISPVLKNPQFDPFAHHGYGVQDFLTIEPRFSSDPERARREPGFAENELRQLVDAAHERGIYVIFDIVLNHVGNVFAYEGGHHDAAWRDWPPYTIWWRDADGNARPDWTSPPQSEDISSDALVWPRELQRNEYFRRQGNGFSRPGDAIELGGDFFSLKELVTAYFEPRPGYGIFHPVWNILITAHQYMIAKYDIDGFRIDTLKYIEPEFACAFGTLIREYAASIGKKNFFTFGEVYDNDEKIARFVGRNAAQGGDLLGIDAALDFPLFFKLPGLAKGQIAPTDLIWMYENRKRVTQNIISSQGEISAYFVTFLDNHDQHNRFHYVDPGDPHRYDDQVTMGLALLFTLQGIPCVYYGTEQGLHGSGPRPEFVRESLWGKPNAFDQTHPFYRAIQHLSELRMKRASLRYGRQYFRPISGNGVDFGFSSYPGGVLAFSRVLADLEVVIIANTNIGQDWSGEVVVDYEIRPGEFTYRPLYSNQRDTEGWHHKTPAEKPEGTVKLYDLHGPVGVGPLRTLRVDLQPCEVQIWGKGL